MNAINITAYPNDLSQVEALKAVMKALNIKFEISKSKISNNETHNAEYLAKIKESREQAQKGQVTRVKKEDINKFLGI